MLGYFIEKARKIGNMSDDEGGTILWVSFFHSLIKCRIKWPKRGLLVLGRSRHPPVLRGLLLDASRTRASGLFPVPFSICHKTRTRRLVGWLAPIFTILLLVPKPNDDLFLPKIAPRSLRAVFLQSQIAHLYTSKYILKVVQWQHSTRQISTCGIWVGQWMAFKFMSRNQDLPHCLAELTIKLEQFEYVGCFTIR